MDNVAPLFSVLTNGQIISIQVLPASDQTALGTNTVATLPNEVVNDQKNNLVVASNEQYDANLCADTHQQRVSDGRNTGYKSTRNDRVQDLRVGANERGRF